MDIIYYSNHCPHSLRILNELKQNNQLQSFGFICVDKRKIHPQNGQYIIILENGQQHALPPNINNVPALLLNKNKNVVFGNDIIEHLKPKVDTNTISEPAGFLFGNSSLGGLGDTFSSFSNSSNNTMMFKPDNFVPKLDEESSKKLMEDMEKARQNDLNSIKR